MLELFLEKLKSDQNGGCHVQQRTGLKFVVD